MKHQVLTMIDVINQQWEEKFDKMVAEIEHVYEYLDKYDTGALPTSYERVMEIIDKYRKSTLKHLDCPREYEK